MHYFTRLKAFPNGGRIYIMDGFIKKSDYEDLLTIAYFFAQQGHVVQIPTEVHYKDEKYKRIFGNLTGTIYERKCPDLIIDGVFYEYESFVPPFKKEKIRHMISKGLQQASRVIIKNGGADDNFIQKCILNRINEKIFRYQIDEVWVFEEGTFRVLYKQ
ncbi:MAG: hypothetical protein LBN93_02580 [Candidatus Symbiothrix sp.]|jgi:hypothetical protein|nr:hypothetical protein [Candidatus Symbiothrix sp.]